MHRDDTVLVHSFDQGIWERGGAWDQKNPDLYYCQLSSLVAQWLDSLIIDTQYIIVDTNIRLYRFLRVRLELGSSEYKASAITVVLTRHASYKSLI